MRAVEEVARRSYGRLLAHLAAGTRDLASAEDALAGAFESALRTWPARGVPERPEAWLLTAARRALIDAARRRDVATRALPDLARLRDDEPAPDPDVAAIPDTRLELMFTCAHPAIAVGVRSPLMLQTVLGLDAARIAAAFLVSPASMGQRLVRAKAKIKEAGIPFAVPAPADLPARLEFVLDAVYAAYGTGWDDPAGRDQRRRGLAGEAVRLARLVAELLPDEPEAHGLLAALLHGEAREAARRSDHGAFVPLDEQDVGRWSPALMAEAERHLSTAAARRVPGPYQLQAAIQSVHNRRALTGRTDWASIAALYDGLVTMTPSVGAHVARAAAHMQAGAATAAIAMLDALDGGLVAAYQPYWVVRAHCLHRTGADAAQAARVALGLTEDPAVRRHLAETFGGWSADASLPSAPARSEGVPMTLIGEVPPGLAATAARIGDATTVLDEDQVTGFVREQLAAHPFDGRSVCVLVPDATRTCPLPLLLRAVHDALHGRVSRLTVLIALGTHAPMGEEALAAHLGYAPGRLAETYPGTTVVNHEWWKPETFADLGTIPAARIVELSEGRMDLDVPVLLNRAVVEHDVALVLGPVLPHEVVGISGGNKYFFPGVGGQKIIDVSHWLGALITSAEIIGTTGITPVRALIDDGAALIPSEKLAFCAVTAEVADGSVDGAVDATVSSPVRTSGLHSVSFGDTRASWANAAQVCAATHVTYLDAPVRRVLSIIPEMYDEIWTGAKGFYKLEPVVADGGEVILYAPHIREISSTHKEIYDIGYHCRDYFVKQWDRFESVHWGVLAHSTHLRGAGTYDAETGEERLRVAVTLATAIPEDVCRAANLGYLDPDSVNVAAFEADPDTLVVPRAGEMLFRLR